MYVSFIMFWTKLCILIFVCLIMRCEGKLIKISSKSQGKGCIINSFVNWIHGLFDGILFGSLHWEYHTNFDDLHESYLRINIINIMAFTWSLHKGAYHAKFDDVTWSKQWEYQEQFVGLHDIKHIMLYLMIFTWSKPREYSGKFDFYLNCVWKIC